MEFKTTFIKARKRAFTLIELMIGMSIATMAMAILGVTTSMMLTSFDSMSNYIELEQQSRLTLDKMSREIRSASKVIGYAESWRVMIQLEEGPTVVNCAYYWYNSNTRTMYRHDFTKDTTQGPNSGFTPTGSFEVVLENVDQMTFSYFQRNPKNGTYEQESASSIDTIKLLQLNWLCSLENFVGTQNTELVQSAKFVIRRQ